jgi:phosphatidyl-myo-inositol dimannoside synthase
MRALVLLSDGFGGFGGIARFNRDFLTALCSAPGVEHVTAVPRVMPGAPERLPANLTHDPSGLGGKLGYLHAVIRAARSVADSPLHLERGEGQGEVSNAPHLPSASYPLPGPIVVCAHLNLLPLAWLAQRIIQSRMPFPPRAGRGLGKVLSSSPVNTGVPSSRCPLIVNLHGVEAWTPHHNPIVRRFLKQVNAFISVSQFTWQRFTAWSGVQAPMHLLPNCVDLAAFGPGPKRADLVARYGLEGRKVMMVLARLSAAERYKGVDEVLAVLPALAQKIPNLAYVICGHGDDRPRLMNKARSLGLAVLDPTLSASNGERGRGEVPREPSHHASPTSDLRPLNSGPLVIFTGRIPEEEKADHYRLADAFVMVGRGEGFGIVYLEALACGIPVVASTTDASREAVREGELGELADPGNPADIQRAVLAALQQPRGKVPAGLDYFSARQFATRCSEMLNGVTGASTISPRETVHA